VSETQPTKRGRSNDDNDRPDDSAAGSLGKRARKPRRTAGDSPRPDDANDDDDEKQTSSKRHPRPEHREAKLGGPPPIAANPDRPGFGLLPPRPKPEPPEEDDEEREPGWDG
jgi:hypothetical protein